VGEPLTTQTAVSAKLLRPFTDNELGSIDGLISEASSQLRWIRPDIDSSIAAWPQGGIDPDIVRGMLASVIKRVLVNPKGLWSTSETEGDYSISETYPGSRAGDAAASGGGDLQITADDLAKLIPPGRLRRGSICTPARGYVAGRRLR
jgi:hypothetical protein